MFSTHAPHPGDIAHHAFPHHGGPFVMCLIVLALVATAFYLARKGRLGPPPWAGACRSPEDAALAKLHQRFADGDMTPEDYTTRVRLIREHGRPGGSPADDLGTPRA